jgi:hypothetical protein
MANLIGLEFQYWKSLSVFDISLPTGFNLVAMGHETPKGPMRLQVGMIWWLRVDINIMVNDDLDINRIEIGYRVLGSTRWRWTESRRPSLSALNWKD